MRCMEQPIRILFGKNIKRLRKKRGLTQEELAEKSGIDYKYIQKLEGKTPPAVKIDTIKRIASVFKVDPSEMLKSKSK